MTKRVQTLLLGLGLIAVGGIFFVATSRAYALQSLSKGWPLFLALAGVVRVVGFLLDREPRSPVGGMMLTAVGGALLAFNFSHELPNPALRGALWLAFVGQYWFWFLLAFVTGRVLRQYVAQAHPLPGKRTSGAFSFGAVCVMALITAAGLAANYAERHRLPIFHATLEASDQ